MRFPQKPGDALLFHPVWHAAVTASKINQVTLRLPVEIIVKTVSLQLELLLLNFEQLFKLRLLKPHKALDVLRIIG